MSHFVVHTRADIAAVVDNSVGCLAADCIVVGVGNLDYKLAEVDSLDCMQAVG